MCVANEPAAAAAVVVVVVVVVVVDGGPCCACIWVAIRSGSCVLTSDDT